MVRRSHRRFAAVMTIYGAVSLLGITFLAQHDDLLKPLLTPLTVSTARVTLALIHWCGMEAAGKADLIAHPRGFVYQVAYGCIGLIPIASLIVSILAYPAPFRHKWAGIALGVPIVILLNLARLVHLFYIGVYRPDLFEFFHDRL